MASNKEQQLKHLDFVRVIAINALVFVSNLYEKAKLNSGAYKSRVDSVESAVTAIVSPVYDKFKGVPAYVLVFLDTKVDEATNRFDELAPPLAKELVRQTKFVVIKLSDAAKQLGQVAKADGPSSAILYANSLYKDAVLIQLAKLWYGINQIPPLNVVAQMTVPTAAHMSEKYNEVIADMAGKGYAIFSYLPLVPIDEIAKAYKQVEAAKAGKPIASDESEIEVVG